MSLAKEADPSGHSLAAKRDQYAARISIYTSPVSRKLLQKPANPHWGLRRVSERHGVVSELTSDPVNW